MRALSVVRGATASNSGAAYGRGEPSQAAADLLGRSGMPPPGAAAPSAPALDGQAASTNQPAQGGLLGAWNIVDWVLGRRRPEGPPPGSPAAVAAAAEAAAALAAWEAEEEQIGDYEYEEEEAYADPYRFAKLLIAGGAPVPPAARVS